ncbi:MAG: DNA polymerase III subunit alpha [Acidobacteria bacterium]|nr:MAG: DNA polymerase III subunit alpha [Acidobacteriota bacterium]
MTHYHHLYIQSHFSLMWGTASLEQLARRLKEDQQTAFPLTDRNGLYGLVQHIQICQSSGLRPIIGCELFRETVFPPSQRSFKRTLEGTPPPDQTLCLVKSKPGYRNLCRMLTDLSFQPRRALWELLRDRLEGLILITQTPSILAFHRDGAEVYIDLALGRMARAVELHEQWNLPMVATVHAALPQTQDMQRHLVLRAIDTNSKLSQRHLFQHAAAENVLCSRAHAQARFAAFPEAVRRTGSILDSCEYVPATGKLIFPSNTHGKNAQILRRKAYDGALRRLGSVQRETRERLEFELTLIRKKNFESPFLIAEDVVHHFPITCGRGSAAASLVAYCLGITHVNPLTHHLFFERFLNEGRKDPPDIDIDFPWDQRNQVRDYLWKKYGRNRIAMVANTNHLQFDGALREVAKVFGFGSHEVTHFTRTLHRLKRGLYQPRFTPVWQKVVKWARMLEGSPRCLGVHCGGVVITPQDISFYAPLLDMPIGYPTLPWDKDDVEAYGFIKLDFLGNRSLAVIRDTLQSVSRSKHKKQKELPAYDQLNPIDDPNTQRLIAAGRTIGCFYIESPATRQLLQKAGHGDYETLVAISSIIRPAANAVTEKWVKRHRRFKKGLPPDWDPVHPLFEEVLRETHGLMVYQEDVTRTAMALAGFDAFEGNLLRKIMSKKAPEKLTALKEKFIRGCKQNRLTQNQIDTVWSMIESFSGYSFCKPHSASYALVSFKSAYLKLNYPEHFLAAVLANYGGYYSTYTYLSYARRLGIPVRLPDINWSQKSFSASKRCILIGFDQIKGLKESSIQMILKARSSGFFKDLNGFLARVPLPRKELRKLILIGCFDEIEPGRTRSSLMLHALCHDPEGKEQILKPFAPSTENIPELPAFTEKQRDDIEQAFLTFPVSRTPLQQYMPITRRIPHILSESLKDHIGQTVTVFGTLLSAKTVRTKTKDAMSFLTFEDESELFECVAFPTAYRQFATIMEYDQSYLLRGQVEEQLGAVSLHLNYMKKLDPQMLLTYTQSSML